MVSQAKTQTKRSIVLTLASIEHKSGRYSLRTTNVIYLYSIICSFIHSPNNNFFGPNPFRTFCYSCPRQAEEGEDEPDVAVAVEVAHHGDLLLVPGRVPEHGLHEEASLQHRLLVAEHLEGVLAVVLPEPALPDAAERQRVDPVLQKCKENSTVTTTQNRRW